MIEQLTAAVHARATNSQRRSSPGHPHVLRKGPARLARPGRQDRGVRAADPAASPRRLQAHGGRRSAVILPDRELASQIGESFAGLRQEPRYKHAVISAASARAAAPRRAPPRHPARRRAALDLATSARSTCRARHLRPRRGRPHLDMASSMPQRVIALIPRVKQPCSSRDLPPRRSGSPTCCSSIRDRAVSSRGRRGRGDRPERYFVEKAASDAARRRALRQPDMRRVLCSPTSTAPRVAEHLVKDGVPAEAIHGNKSQTRASGRSTLNNGKRRCWARRHRGARPSTSTTSPLVNFDLRVPETTPLIAARPGRRLGIAISFCDAERPACSATPRS